MSCLEINIKMDKPLYNWRVTYNYKVLSIKQRFEGNRCESDRFTTVPFKPLFDQDREISLYFHF